MDCESGDGTPTDLAKAINDRRLPKWREAKVKTGWSLSLRSRTILYRRQIYGLGGYRSYRANSLRSDYSEIEMDLQSVFAHFGTTAWFDRASACQVVKILDSVRADLEEPNPNLDVVDADLGRARRLMVWVEPDDWIDAITERTQARLDRLHVRSSLSPARQGAPVSRRLRDHTAGAS